MNKAILIPLCLLLAVSVFNMLKIGDSSGFRTYVIDSEGRVVNASSGEVAFAKVGPQSGYWDEDGHLVLNSTHQFVDDMGSLVHDYQTGYMHFWNDTYNMGTDGYGGYWVLHDTPNDKDIDDYAAGASADPPDFLNWTVGGTFGFLGILGAGMFVATVVGVRVIGIGISETSISSLVKGMLYISLFLLCSSMSMTVILSIPTLGPIIVLGLTFVYTAGVISVWGNSGGGD